MRRRIGYVLRWLLLFAFFFGLRYVLGPRDSAEQVAAMAITAALWATLIPLLPALTRRMHGGRRKGSGDHLAATWRAYDRGRPGRWREAWLHRSGPLVVVVPNLGKGVAKVSPDDVREVRERAVTRRESWQVYGSSRVLEIELDEGRLDLAVAPEDVEDLRCWLGAVEGVPA